MNATDSPRGHAVVEAPTCTDHAEATAELLQRVVDLLKAGTSPEDMGRQVELIGRMMARRT